MCICTFIGMLVLLHEETHFSLIKSSELNRIWLCWIIVQISINIIMHMYTMSIVHLNIQSLVVCLISLSILDDFKCSFTDSDGCNHFFYVQPTIILVENDRGIQYHTNTHVYNNNNYYALPYNIIYFSYTYTVMCVYI